MAPTVSFLEEMGAELLSQVLLRCNCNNSAVGEFNEQGLISDLTGLTPQQVLAVYEWAQFYEKEYKKVGVLHERYYDEVSWLFILCSFLQHGNPTRAMEQVIHWVAEAQELKRKEEERNKIMPGIHVPQHWWLTICANRMQFTVGSQQRW